jgi:uncharacterized protein (DUF2384 family)
MVPRIAALPIKKSREQVALEAFRRLAERWKLKIEEQEVLLGTPKRTMYAWYKHPEHASLHRDKLERISYLLGILSGLTAVYGNNVRADEWLRRPNDAFDGRTPLACMLNGNVGDLAAIRSYVDRFAHVGW